MKSAISRSENSYMANKNWNSIKEMPPFKNVPVPPPPECRTFSVNPVGMCIFFSFFKFVYLFIYLFCIGKVGKSEKGNQMRIFFSQEKMILYSGEVTSLELVI